MNGWFVPPIVIPILIAVSFVGYVSLGYSFEIGNLRDGW